MRFTKRLSPFLIINSLVSTSLLELNSKLSQSLGPRNNSETSVQGKINLGPSEHSSLALNNASGISKSFEIKVFMSKVDLDLFYNSKLTFVNYIIDLPVDMTNHSSLRLR